MANQPPKQDIYTRVTNQITLQLEKGIRPWIKPWSVEHTAGRTRAVFTQPAPFEAADGGKRDPGNKSAALRAPQPAPLATNPSQHLK